MRITRKNNLVLKSFLVFWLNKSLENFLITETHLIGLERKPKHPSNTDAGSALENYGMFLIFFLRLDWNCIKQSLEKTSAHVKRQQRNYCHADILVLIALLCSTIRGGWGKGNIKQILELLPWMSTHSSNMLLWSKTLKKTN